MNLTGLRIALVGPLPPPSGGMANQTLQLARLLAEAGALVEVIQVNRPYSPAWIGRIKGVRALFRLPSYLLHLWRVAGKVQLVHIMANSGWSWHLFAAPAIWIASLRGAAVVVNYRGGEAGEFFKESIGSVRPSLNRTNVIIVPSGFLENIFSQYGFKTQIVPNIIDLSRFSAKDRSPISNPNSAQSPHILVTRNLEPIYDNGTAIRAFKRVKETFHNAKLTIAGSGPEREVLMKLASQLDIADAVHFTGRVENHNIAALYDSADIVVNPSLADNMPISVLEALASGVPVVSTNVGGVPFLVEHGKTAVLVPPKNPDDMATAILELLTNAEKARQLSRAGIESITKYTWPQVRIRLASAYQLALSAKTI